MISFGAFAAMISFSYLWNFSLTEIFWSGLEVHSFNSYRASGVNINPMRIIKLSIDIIVEPLTEIINVSLVSGCFPDTLKIAKVLPIFKTGDPEKLENYLPISILPAFLNFTKKWFIIVFINTYKS